MNVARISLIETKREPTYKSLMKASNQIQVFIGDRIGNPAERAFLAKIVETLKHSRQPATLLANFQCGGRQIDCVVAMESGIALFEIKASTAPVKGEINGAWERQKPDGNWAVYTNGYNQALDAKNRLRDEMSRFKSLDGYYPSAFVVFPFGVPEGSQLTGGDFKVRVNRNDLVELWFSEQGSLAWSLDDWTAFAEWLSLERVGLADILAGPEDEKRREILARYMSAFVDEFGEQGRAWLPEAEDQTATIQQDILSPHGAVIYGPSGCGKTLLAKWIACELTEQGSPCLLIPAKDFTGDWRTCLVREMALLTDDPTQDVLAAMRAVSAPAYLILDGLNELDSARRDRALRGLNAMARKFGFRILVTCQRAPPASLQALASIRIVPPSQALKHRIAEASGNQLNSAAMDMLDAVESGMEAFIIGELGALKEGLDTRSQLVDQFIRTRLGVFAREGSRACRCLAFELAERVAFSISEIELDDLLSEAGVSTSTVDALFDNSVLVRRSGRVSFRHEILQSGCAAFRLAQKATEGPAAMGPVLSGPSHNYLAQDALGALESVDACVAVMRTLTDGELIARAASSGLGAVAQAAADVLLAETKTSVLKEISTARLRYAGEVDAKYIEWDPATVSIRSQEEIVRLRALGLLTLRGHAVSTYLELCRAADARLVEERQRLSDLARSYNSPIKSQSFALLHGYGFGGGAIGFTTIVSTLQSTFEKGRIISGLPPTSLLSLTSSEVYFYLESKRRAEDFWDSEDFSDQLSEFLGQRFRYEPYHLKLASLDACLGLGDMSPARHERLTTMVRNILESTQNWAISSTAFDVLRMMGSLDDDAQGHRQSVRDNIKAVLESGDLSSEDRAELALSLYVGQFDHPYSTAYCEEWNDLTDDQHRRMLRWAIRSEGLKNTLSLNWIVQEVAEFDDPADVELLRPFTLFPDPKAFVPDDVMSAFCTACRVFGRHGAQLPVVEPASDGARILEVLRKLVHHIGSEASDTAAEGVWDELAVQPMHLVLGCLFDVQRALNYWSPAPQEKLLGPVDIIERYPKQCLRLSRQFVDAGQPAVGYRGERPLSGSRDRLAFQIIEKYGDRTDLDRLRKASSWHAWASHAVPAIRALDSLTEAN